MTPRLPRLAAPARRGGHGFAAALFEGLVAAGVERVCVCPGSRSTPLALAAASTAGLEGFVHFDERSAGYFALGLARVSRRPVALVCTSGTAAANFAPAVIEAHHARVPLVVLTADRPPERRDWGAPQTIDQSRLFGAALRWYAEAPCPASDTNADAPDREPGESYARALGARAAAVAAGSPRGPVHLNLPFREPLEPALTGPAPTGQAPSGPASSCTGPPAVIAAPRIPSPATLDALAAQASQARRPLLVCGPMDADAALRRAVQAFARRSGWPVLVDGASGLRGAPGRGAPGRGTPSPGASGPPSAPVWVERGAALLAAEEFRNRQAPELVVRLGPPPTAKPFGAWLAQHAAARLWVVDGDAGFSDPDHRAAAHLHADPAALLDGLAERLPGGGPDPDWSARWADAERSADRAIRVALDKEPGLGHPGIAAALAGALPEGALLFASNSLPVRAVDGFFVPGRRVRVLANRGANGIDGVLSSALGAAAAGRRPAALLVGDLALLHDAGALALAARLEIDCVIVVVHNDGGGIFDQLPIARQGEAVGFEALFTAPHGRDLAAVARGFGVAAESVATPVAFREGLARALDAGGVRVLEARIERRADLAARERIQSEVASALRVLTP